MGVLAISFQMGVRGLITVNLGVLDVKTFEDHCVNTIIINIFIQTFNLGAYDSVACLIGYLIDCDYFRSVTD